ncbi:MAG TPA: PAS domain S-box protein, partial [Thermomicrobiales bacterium]|nr:PAS domain S-box protein [Thermomicrobiales bacterium]
MLEVNQRFLDLIGFERDEVIGTRPPHVWWPDDETRAMFQEAGQRYLRGEASEDRVVYRRKDGATFPALVTSGPLRDDDGQIVGFVGSIKDISDWAAVERQLAFQAQLIDRVQAAVVATDGAGRVILWSSGAEELFGYRREDMLGRDLMPLFVE